MVTIEEIDAFLIETGVSPSAFGLSIISSNKLVKSLRCGREMTQMLSDRIREFMHDTRVNAKGPPRVMLPDESKSMLHSDYIYRRDMQRASKNLIAAIKREHPDIFPEEVAS